ETPTNHQLPFIGGINQKLWNRNYLRSATFLSLDQDLDDDLSNPPPNTEQGSNISDANSKEHEIDADMAILRQAEIVILREEEKFGKHCRDLQGRVVPVLQVASQISIDTGIQ